MVEWILFWAVVAVFLIIKLLDYFDVLDIAELLGAILRLVTGAIALLGAALMWSARKLARTKPEPKPPETRPAPRGDFRTRSMSRNGRSIRP